LISSLREAVYSSRCPHWNYGAYHHKKTEALHPLYSAMKIEDSVSCSFFSSAKILVRINAGGIQGRTPCFGLKGEAGVISVARHATCPRALLHEFGLRIALLLQAFKVFNGSASATSLLIRILKRATRACIDGPQALVRRGHTLRGGLGAFDLSKYAKCFSCSRDFVRRARARGGYCYAARRSSRAVLAGKASTRARCRFAYQTLGPSRYTGQTRSCERCPARNRRLTGAVRASRGHHLILHVDLRRIVI
jgi:hypothetical protein